jgi:Sulfotransferase family
MTGQQVHRIVAGYGRSGTTWIQDVLARSNLLRAVFEPLHPRFVAGANEFAHRYLSEEYREAELYRFLHRFLCDNYHSLWVDYRLIKRDLLPRQGDLTSWRGCRKFLWHYLEFKRNFSRFRKQRRHPHRIVKLIRANLMLPWLQANFDARIVFIIRHPAAVVLSQMTAPRSWNPYGCIERYRADSGLLDVLDSQTRRLLSQKIDSLEAYTLCWCIENSVALEQAQRHGIPIVYYEHLLQRGLPEWQRILSALELQQMPEKQLILQPSQQAWGRKATDSTLLLKHASWMEKIDSSAADRIQRVLDTTGMEAYNVHNSLPVACNDLGP